MESKRRDVWSDREIREMLSIVNEKHITQLLDGKVKRNKEIFDDIATELKKKNILKSEVQIRNKFKSLKSDFYKVKRSNNESGAKRQTSEHFHLLNDIFGHRRPALEAAGVDTIEMDLADDVESIASVKDVSWLAEEGTSCVSSQDDQPTTSKSQSSKRIKKNSKKRDHWSDRQIREMLSIVNEKHIKKLKKVKRNKEIFDDIATELKKKNILKSEVQIRNKFKSLKSDFYKVKRSNDTSGGKRQTSEHFDLLDEIFGHRRPALEAAGVDTIEMDLADDVESKPSVKDVTCIAEEDTSYVSLGDKKPTTSKSQGFKRIKKNSYQKMLETFSKEWKESQEEMLEKIREQNEKLVDYQAKKQEQIMEKNRNAMKKMLEEDRKETSKIFHQFLSALQPGRANNMFQSPQFFEIDQSLATPATYPKLSPPYNGNG